MSYDEAPFLTLVIRAQVCQTNDFACDKVLDSGKGTTYKTLGAVLGQVKLREVKRRMCTLTFSMIQTKLIADPMSTCSSPEPSMNASGTTTCKFTKCDIAPVEVAT